jgi:multicomponent K+:H+ antiporter subunit A
MTRPLPETISSFFVRNAWPEGGGTNVVNVIIVDFRGFDTLGEISVLGVVALSVYALLRRFRPARESLGAPRMREGHGSAAFAEDLLVPSVIMRLLFPAILALVLFLLLRGHNLPGGGFAAGLTLAIAVILQYMAGGTRWAESRLAIRPLRWIGSGLLLAAITGAAALLFAHPFLTSHAAHAVLPILGEVHLPSAFFFDLGVFALVVGATGLILIALAHQSTRSSWS